MKVFMKVTLATFLVGALVSIGAFAGDKNRTETKTVTLSLDVMVNGTLIKAGQYQVKFDEANNELSILKDGKVKAKTPVHLEDRTDKAKETAFRTIEKGGVNELLGVSFQGWKQDVIAGANGTTGGSQ